MRKKSLRLSAACAVLMLAMTGCGNQIPDLTEEEMQKVGEYAAITLLKYDANHRSRLVDVALLETQEAEAEPEQEIEEPAPEPIPEPTPESSAVDATTDTEAGEDAIISAAEAEIETFYELPNNIEITYKGYEICTSYPEDDSNDYFALEAAQGKKLLVLDFDVKNATSAEKSIDLFSSTSVYRVTLNGTYTENALTTMLMNDMSTFVSAIPANSSQNVVLVVEIEEDMANNISTITLNMKNESKTYTIQLL